MDMIERVARAITENQMRTANELFKISDQRRVRTEEQISASIEAGWPMNTKDARAAIEAMREPTPDMEEAADEPVHAELKAQGQFSMLKYGKLAFASYPFSVAVWKSMVDAALKEHEVSKADGR